METASRLLADVLRVYSPTNREEKVASLIRRKMREEFGYKDLKTDDAGNVIAEVGRGRRTVLFCGHMDTVPGKLPVSLKDGKVYGRGAVDAKSPLCAMIVAGSRLHDAGLKVVVACVTREEGDSLGIKTLLGRGRSFDYAVFGEPGGSGKVTVGYRGRVGVQLTTRTEGGHAGSPWAHESAIDASLSLVALLKKYELEHQVPKDHFHSLSLCVTVFKGGTYHNVLPNLARLTLDVRVPPGMSSTQVEKEIRELVARRASEESRATFEVSFDEPTEPYEVDPSSKLVRVFQRAIIRKTGQRPVMLRKTGTGDMNTLAASRGTPCVTYGPGESNLSHTQLEHVDLGDYMKSIDVLSEAVTELEALPGA